MRIFIEHCAPRSTDLSMIPGASMSSRLMLPAICSVVLLMAFVLPLHAQQEEVVRNDVYQFDIRDVDGRALFYIQGIAPHLASEVRIPRRVLRFRMPATDMHDVVLREAVLSDPFGASPFYRVDYTLSEDSALIPQVLPTEAPPGALADGGAVRILNRSWKRIGDEVELAITVPLLTWDATLGQTSWVREYRFAHVPADGITAPPLAEGKPPYSSMPFTTKSKNVDTTQAWIDYQNPMVKFFIDEDGLYRIDADWLAASGVDPAGVNPSTVQLYRKGVAVSMYAQGMDDGSIDEGDAFIFHATRNYDEGGYRFIPEDLEDPYPQYLSIYTDSTAYWLHFNTPDPLRTADAPLMSPLPLDTVDWAYELVHIESEGILASTSPSAVLAQVPNWHAYQTWFAQWLHLNRAVTYRFNADNVKYGETARAWFKVLHWYSSIAGLSHSVTLHINGSPRIDSIVFEGGEQALLHGEIPSDSIKAGRNDLTADSHDIGDPYSDLVHDWGDVEYPRKLVVGNTQLDFRHDSAMGTGPLLLKFTNVPDQSPILLKVMEDGRTVVLPVASFSVDDGYTVVFADTLVTGAEYYISSAAQLRQPNIGKKVDLDPLADGDSPAYLLVTTDEMRVAGEQYADFVATSYGVSTRVTTIEEIYNTYSYGMFLPEAMKVLFFDLYHAAGTDTLQHILLVGDANYNYRASTSAYSRNYVPSYGAPASDVWFVAFDPEAARPDIAIGRLPITNDEQLLRYLAKHQDYRSQRQDMWNKTSIHFSGGLEAEVEFQKYKGINDRLIAAEVSPRPYAGRATHFYKTETPQSDFGPYTREEFLRVIDEGAIFISYVGHSGTQTWDNSISTPRQLSNDRGRYPLITDFGCSTGRFAEPDIVSFSELFLIDEESQAIAYIGNSAAGFEDIAYRIPEVFYGYLIEGVPSLGQVHLLTKQELYDRAPGSITTEISNQTNCIIGDPIVAMPIPKKPNPVIQPEWIRSVDEIVTDQTDTLHFQVAVGNYGLSPEDSLSVFLEMITGADTWYTERRTISLPTQFDTLQFSIASNNVPGTSRVRVALDGENRIDEIYEDDNTATAAYEVLSTSVKAVNEELGRSRAGNEAMILLNPVYSPGDVESVIFEFATDPQFTSSSTQEVDYGKTVSHLPDPSSLPAGKHFWKAQLESESEFAGPYVRWVGSAAADYIQSDSVEFVNNAGSRIQLGSTDVSLPSADRALSVESSSFPRSFGSVRIDGINVLPNTFFRSFGLAILDSATLEVKYGGLFDPYGVFLGSMDSLVTLLEGVQFGELAVISTADEPRQGAGVIKEAVEALGSAQIDSVGRFYRSAWALIGRRGAAPGTVPEKFTRYGTIILDTTFFVPPDTGWIVSPRIGPARAWEEVMLERSDPGSTTIILSVYGVDTTGAEVLLREAGNVTQTGIGDVDASLYPYIRLRATLIPGTPEPVLDSWSVEYTQPAELALNYQSVEVLADTVNQGDPVPLTVGIINAGEASSGPFPVQVEAVGEDNIPRPVAEFTVTDITSMQWFDSTVTVNTDFLKGAQQLFVRVDRGDLVHEQFEDNNTFITSFYVRPDTSTPQLDVTFDGFTPLNGDYVRPTPEIVVTLRSSSPYPIESAEHFDVTLDGLALDLDSIDHDLTPSTKESPATLRFQPHLDDGVYYFGFNARDGKDVPVYEDEVPEIMVRVSTEGRIAELYNFPNPFQRETAFTFLLTGAEPPQDIEVKIYTVAGRMIRRLAFPASSMRIGYNALKWDGRDQDGDELANGVYFYKVIATFPDKSFEEIGRMAVMR